MRSLFLLLSIFVAIFMVSQPEKSFAGEKLRIDMRASFGKCLTVPESVSKPNGNKKGTEHAFVLSALLGGVVEALIPSVIDKGIGLLTSAISKAGADQEATFNVSTPADLYKYNPESNTIIINDGFRDQCFRVAQGVFGEVPKPSDSGFDKSKIDESIQSVFGLKEKHDFYYEAQVVYSDDFSAFRLVNRYLDVPAKHKQAAKWSKRTDLVISFSFVPAIKDNILNASQVQFKNVEAKLSLDSKALQDDGTDWMVIPPLPKSASHIVNKVREVNKEIAVLEAKIKVRDRLAKEKAEAENKKTYEETLKAMREGKNSISPYIVGYEDALGKTKKDTKVRELLDNRLTAAKKINSYKLSLEFVPAIDLAGDLKKAKDKRVRC